MGQFSRSLVVEVLDNKRYPYRVCEMFEFSSGQVDSGLLIRCEQGFEFNGTSMPWGTRWLISPADPELLQCSAIHDMGFLTGKVIIRVALMEQQVIVHRSVINALMSEMMRARKVSLWKQYIINIGLALASHIVWRKYAKLRGAARTFTTA